MIVLKEPAADIFFDREPRQLVDIETRSPSKISAVEADRGSPKHQDRRLSRSSLGVKRFGRPGGAFTGLDPLQVGGEFAGIDRSNPIHISRRAKADSVIGIIRPIHQIVPTLLARPREVRDFVHHQAGVGQPIDCGGVHRSLGFLVDLANLAGLPLFPERGPFLVDEAVT